MESSTDFPSEAPGFVARTQLYHSNNPDFLFIYFFVLYCLWLVSFLSQSHEQQLKE